MIVCLYYNLALLSGASLRYWKRINWMARVLLREANNRDSRWTQVCPDWRLPPRANHAVRSEWHWKQTRASNSLHLALSLSLYIQSLSLYTQSLSISPLIWAPSEFLFQRGQSTFVRAHVIYKQ